MSRVAAMIEKLEQGEPVDLKREAGLLALDAVKLGEDFAAEITALMAGGDSRYDRVKTIEFFENGAIKRVEMRDPEGDDDAEAG